MRSWGEGTKRPMLRVHSEPLYEPKLVPATDVAAAPALTSAAPHNSRPRRPGRRHARPEAKAHLTPIAPEAHGTFAEAINLERLSTFPRRRMTDKEDDALPYMRRQPQLLSTLQFFADAELKKRCGEQDDDDGAAGPSDAALSVWREVFTRFIEAFGTYKPVLLPVINAYDACLKHATDQRAAAEMEVATKSLKLDRLQSVAADRERAHAELVAGLEVISNERILSYIHALDDEPKSELLSMAVRALATQPRSELLVGTVMRLPDEARIALLEQICRSTGDGAATAPLLQALLAQLLPSGETWSSGGGGEGGEGSHSSDIGGRGGALVEARGEISEISESAVATLLAMLPEAARAQLSALALKRVNAHQVEDLLEELGFEWEIKGGMTMTQGSSLPSLGTVVATVFADGLDGLEVGDLALQIYSHLSSKKERELPRLLRALLLCAPPEEHAALLRNLIDASTPRNSRTPSPVVGGPADGAAADSAAADAADGGGDAEAAARRASLAHAKHADVHGMLGLVCDGLPPDAALALLLRLAPTVAPALAKGGGAQAVGRALAPALGEGGEWTSHVLALCEGLQLRPPEAEAVLAAATARAAARADASPDPLARKGDASARVSGASAPSTAHAKVEALEAENAALKAELAALRARAAAS